MDHDSRVIVQRKLPLLFWLLAVHSLGVGIGLIAAPEAWFTFFGFAQGGEPFFRIQAGVFHVVMVYIYISAALRGEMSVILLAVAAKLTASVFLFVYYFSIDPIITVLLSGVLDGVMAAAVVLLASSRNRENVKP